MVIVTGYPGYWLVKAIASALRAEQVDVLEKTFPDGEVYVRLTEPEKVVSKDVIVVSTLYPEQDKRLFKTLLIVNAVKNSGAGRIIALIPYLAYSRQDKVFLPGEPVSGCLVSRFLKAAGLDVLVAVDVHSPRVLECFEGKALNALVPDILVSASLRYLENPVVIAPDKGALERALAAARAHGLEYDYLVKHRDKLTGSVTYSPRELNVEGRDVVIVDDIISTGGTVAESAKMLLEKGARRVIVAATHGLLVGGAVEKLEKAGVTRIILADTLAIRHEHRIVEYVDVVPRVVKELEEVVSK